MLQKEVVMRMAAGPGDNNYGRLSIMCQYFCQVQHMFDVGPEAFQPAPKVDSAIVRLAPYATLPHPAKDFKSLENIVRQSFTMRRKTLRNNLKKTISDEQLTELGIDAGLRPERLSLEEYVRIADFVFENKMQSNSESQDG